MNLTNWATTLGQLIDERLERGERTSALVSQLAAGPAFESWLSFESRLLLVQNRKKMELDEQAIDPDGPTPVPKFWITNEWRKVDLYVGEYRPEEPTVDQCHAAVEFKLIHNNKNWQGKLREIQADLAPTRPAKSEMSPTLGRFSLVGLVGKIYRDRSTYPGQMALAPWEHEVVAALKSGPRIVLWEGKRFSVSDPWLTPTDQHFFRLIALTTPADVGRGQPSSR